MLTKKTNISRTRHEIEQRYQEKERHEHETVPDDSIGQRGERRLYKPNADDDYILVQTRHGWLKGQFLGEETALPANTIGQNGEVRVLSTDSYNALIYKVNDEWKVLDADIINESQEVDVDIMILGSSGSAPTESITELQVGSSGSIQQ